MADERTTVIHLVGCVCELCEARADIERLRAKVAELEAERDDWQRRALSS